MWQLAVLTQREHAQREQAQREHAPGAHSCGRIVLIATSSPEALLLPVYTLAKPPVPSGAVNSYLSLTSCSRSAWLSQMTFPSCDVRPVACMAALRVWRAARQEAQDQAQCTIPQAHARICRCCKAGSGPHLACASSARSQRHAPDDHAQMPLRRQLLSETGPDGQACVMWVQYKLLLYTEHDCCCKFSQTS